jgi:hypothetical protein
MKRLDDIKALASRAWALLVRVEPTEWFAIALVANAALSALTK